MVTRIIAIVFAAGSLAASGVLALFGIAAFTGANAVFQEIAAAGIIAASAGLFAAAGIWVRVEQNERATSAASKLSAVIEEIRDRGYDTVDRLEKLSREARR